jgi:hypothetical protein
VQRARGAQRIGQVRGCVVARTEMGASWATRRRGMKGAARREGDVTTVIRSGCDLASGRRERGMQWGGQA